MSRKKLSSIVAGALVLGVLGAVPMAGTASAEPTFTPVAGDVVGVGSDTSQFVLNYLIDGQGSVPGYNAGKAAGSRLVSFDAIGAGLSAQITLREGTSPINRPNGSGAGKSLLHGSGNNPQVNYARSSSELSDTEVSANLQAIPFAVDGLKVAVRSAGSNAPAYLTPSQLVEIYKGNITNWSAVGGSPGVIKPLIPQASSGTRKFFMQELTAANSGVAFTPVAGVETQEHSDVDIKDDPNAIAPFSTGRAKSTPTVKLLGGTSVGGFEAKRALYNVVRQADLAAPWVAAIFGPSGFICSEAARPLVEAAGFDQLATTAKGGVCGEPTQAKTTNFTISQAQAPAAVGTSTALNGQAQGQTVTLTATVSPTSGTNAPTGTVQFSEGGTVKSVVGVSGGKAIATLSNVQVGTHSYVAKFVPTNTATFTGSTSAARSVTVTATAPAKVASKTTVAMDKRFRASQRVKAIVRVSAVGGARGTVVVKDGTRQIAKATLRSSRAAILLPRFKRGVHRLTFRYLGNATTKPSQAVVRVVVTR